MGPILSMSPQLYFEDSESKSSPFVVSVHSNLISKIIPCCVTKKTFRYYAYSGHMEWRIWCGISVGCWIQIFTNPGQLCSLGDIA
jgi:hypothetical protein